MRRSEDGLNWVAVAVEMSGGVQALSRKMGVSRWTVYKWIDRGSMKRIAYETVMKLHELSGVPVEKLTQVDSRGAAESRARKSVRTARSRVGNLTFRDFSLHFGIPGRAVETWIRIGRLNASNGLLVARGRTYVDLKAFESAFS